MKTAVIFILSLTIIITLVAGTAFGAYSGGTGEPNDPYKIAAKGDLLALVANTADYGKYFILTDDIDMQAQVFTTAIIAPAASGGYPFQGTPFTGTFDGNGHKITNFSINGGTNSWLGLFGFVDSGGSVWNLGIENFAVNSSSGSYYVGALVGWNSGNISDCYSTGTVSSNSNVGALVGENSGNISDCYSTGTVSGEDYVGALVGENYYGNISNCYSTGAVSGTYYLGALVGNNFYGSISNCYSTGLVSGTSFVGGLAGLNDNGNISQGYSTGAVSGTSYVGGLVGRNFYAGINNCYSAGKVSGSSGSSFVGGLVGDNWGSVLGSFWDTQTSDQTASSGGTGKMTTEMKTLLTFTSSPARWDFTNETANGTNDYWRMCVNGVYYPHFKWEYSSHGDFACPDGTDLYDLTIFMDQWLLEKLTWDTSPNGGDGIVNFIDWATFADEWQGDMNELANFASQWLKLSPYCADIGGDGVVNFVDFAVFAEHWLEGG
jgi:hypothetical protein